MSDLEAEDQIYNNKDSLDDSFQGLDSDFSFDDDEAGQPSQKSSNLMQWDTSSRDDGSSQQLSISNEVKDNYFPLVSKEYNQLKIKYPEQNIKLKDSPNDSEKDSLNTLATGLSPSPHRSRIRGAKSSRHSSHKFIGPELCARVEEMIKTGLTANEIKERLDITQRIVKKLQAQYQLYGKIIPTKAASDNQQMSIEKQKEFQLIQEIIKGLISKNCSITLKHMQKALKENGISKSRSTIHALLAKMRISRKKLQKIPLERNSCNKIVYRQNYCRMIQQIPLSKQVFLDETIFGLQTAGHYGWAPKGEQPKIYVPANRRKHITLLAAISIRGFEATKIVKGPVTSKHICEFLQHYLDHLQPDQILILDNARMHHAAVVKEKIKELNRPVRYIPAYTPQLNPIENVFSEIKAQYVKLKEDHDLKSNDMIELIQQAIKNMRSKQFSNYYGHYQQWLKKGVAGDLVN